MTNGKKIMPKQFFITKLYPNFKHLLFRHIDRKRQVLFIAVKHNKHITKMETFEYKQKSTTKLS